MPLGHITRPVPLTCRSLCGLGVGIVANSAAKEGGVGRVGLMPFVQADTAMAVAPANVLCVEPLEVSYANGREPTLPVLISPLPEMDEPQR